MTRIQIDKESEYNEGDIKWYFVPDRRRPTIKQRAIIKVGHSFNFDKTDIHWWYKLDGSGIDAEDDKKYEPNELFDTLEDAIQSIKIVKD